LKAIEANMIAPLMLIRAVIGGMKNRRFGRIVNITSQMVKAPSTSLGLSAGARTGLTGACKALSLSVASYNVTINNLLPEQIETERTADLARIRAKEMAVSYEEALKAMINSIAAKRFGRPEEVGAACAFLCSVQASYISGQNLQIDGGSYRGTF
jgi:3-oxoacyl-[acyl-carrier protein] reductase